MKRSSRQPKRQEKPSAAPPVRKQDPNALSRAVRATLTRLLPRHAIVLVVSKGDPALVRSRRYVGWHFPRNRQGQYAGYHPGCSTSAIAHLEALRAEGAGYIALPSTAFWWLDHYPSFRQHLEERYRRVSADADPCHVYSLLDPPAPEDRSVESQLRRVVLEFRRRFAHDPSVLDWESGLELATTFPHLSILLPPEPGPVLPYLAKSVDLVVTGRTVGAQAQEAHRVARSAVIHLDQNSTVLDIQWRAGPRRNPPPSVSLIIPCYNQSHLTETCLRSLFETLPESSRTEVLVVDDGSTDATPKLLEQWKRREPRLRVIRCPSNVGFGAACNRGARKARGALLVFLNNDLVFLPGWLEPLLEVLRKRPKTGAVGGKLILPDGRLQEAGGVVFCDGSALNFARGQAGLDTPLVNFLREVDYCSGALLATPKTFFDRFGGFDRKYQPAYYEDADYCFRLRQSGYEVYYQPASAVVHREGGTSGTDLSRGIKRHQLINRGRFVDRWQHMLHHQPVRPMRVDQAALLALALHSPRSVSRRGAMRNRRALVCAAFPPEPDRDSGSQRLWDLMRLLQADGWAVTFFASNQLRDPRYIRPLQQRGIAVFGSTQVKLQRLLTAGHFDLANLISWSVAEVCIPVIRRVSPATHVLVDSVDLHFLRQARQIFVGGQSQTAPAQLDTRFGVDMARELNVYAASDAVLTVSAREANILGDLIPQPGLAQVLPDIEQPAKSPAPMSKRRGMLFTGSFRHAPNVDALEFLCRDVLPHLSPTLTARHPLYVVGDPADTNLGHLVSELPNVRLVGRVPSIQPYLNRARLSVVPIRYGAGTKRKLLQSLMAGTPAVSTTLGAEGFGIRDGEHVLIADDPEQFARAIVRLLTEPRLWRKLARNGRDLVQDSHSQRAVRQKFRCTLKHVLQRAPKGGRAIQPGSAPQSTRLDLQQYQDLQDRIREQVATTLPANSSILVVSRGDAELLKLGEIKASHFPQAENGGFAGYHPGDSDAAIAHLRALQTRGAEYLLFPQTSFWWLDYYRELTNHLEQRHVQLLRNDTCVLFRLCKVPRLDTSRRNARLNRTKPSARSASSGRQPTSSRSTQLESHQTLCRPEISGQQTVNPVLEAGPQLASDGRSDIVCLPIIDWGFRFQRPQQLMLRFAAAGHRVFYVSQQFRRSDPPYLIKRLLPNVFEVSLRGPSLNIYRDVLSGASGHALISSLSALRTDQSIQEAILVVQLPFWWSLAQQARRKFGWPIIYDCMDDHAGFETNQPRMLDAEGTLLTEANLVVASSAPLEAQARRHNSNVVLVRNGCDYEHFAKIRPRSKTAAPVVGYYGAIAHWFDAELVADLAERRPDWQFLLVGSTHTADLGRLGQLSNVSLPGEQPYAAIPRWLARFDVAILPFKRNRLTESTNPVKAYEILAAGKPLVTVPLPEMLSLGPLVQTASTPEEFEREIERAVHHPTSGQISSRRAFARQHTWQARWEALVPRLHAVMVHHGAATDGIPGESAPKRADRSSSRIRRSPQNNNPPG